MSFVPPSGLVRPILSEDEDRPARPFPLHPPIWWALLWCVGMILLTQVPGGVIGAAYILFVALFFPAELNFRAGGTPQEMMAQPQIQVGIGLAVGIAHLLLILFSLVVLRIVAGRDWARQVAWRLPTLSHVGLILAMAPAFMVLANLVFYVLRDKFHLPTFLDPRKNDGVPDMEAMINAWPLALAVALIGILPAISEEFWCRAFLGRGLVGLHGYVAGVLFTSLLFGLIHLDPCQGGMAAVVGVLLHYVYLTTRSLLAPMLLHFCNNAGSVVLSRWSDDLEPLNKAMDLNAPGEPTAFLYAAAALVLAAVVAALYQSRARLLLGDGEPAWRPSYPGVALPPPDSGATVATPTPSLASLAMVALSLIAFVVAVASIFAKVHG